MNDTDRAVQEAYQFNLFFLAAFVVGIFIAELCRKHDAGSANDDALKVSSTRLLLRPHLWTTPVALRGWLADTCFFSVFAFIAACPDGVFAFDLLQYQAATNPWQLVLPHLLTPVHAAFVYGSAAGGGTGLAAAFLRHPILISLSSFAIQAYIFQDTIFQLTAVPASTFSKVVFLPLLWTFATLYAIFLEKPCVLLMRRKLLGSQKASH